MSVLWCRHSYQIVHLEISARKGTSTTWFSSSRLIFDYKITVWEKILSCYQTMKSSTFSLCKILKKLFNFSIFGPTLGHSVFQNLDTSTCSSLLTNNSFNVCHISNVFLIAIKTLKPFLISANKGESQQPYYALTNRRKKT